MNFIPLDPTGTNYYGGAAATDYREDGSVGANPDSMEWSEFWDVINGKDTERAYNTAAAYMSHLYDLELQSNQFRHSSEEAQKEREWYERLSNTAVQRQMADLKSAGVNPFYAFSQGTAGAPTASGASAQSMSPTGSAKASTTSNNSASNLTSIFGTMLKAIGTIVAASAFAK